MLTILVKTIDNTHNNILAKIIADTNTNTAFEKYCQYQYQQFCDDTFHCLLHSTKLIFPRSIINKVNRMVVVEKWQNHYSLQWHNVS